MIGVLGWRWQSTATVKRVAVSGATNAVSDTVRHMARVDSGTVMDAIDESLLVDRVVRHPWIKSAEVTKQRLHRTLLISVTERIPAARVINEDGEPAYYLNRAGYAMPLVEQREYDVPLVRGLDAEYHPVERVAPPSLQTMLGALPGTDAAPLIAEFVLQADSTVQLVTVPLKDHGVLTVRLGRGRIPAKLRRFRAFTEQVLTIKSEQEVAEIDLRFDGQIVTREKPLGG